MGSIIKKGRTRREFLKGAGAVMAGGVVIGVVGSQLSCDELVTTETVTVPAGGVRHSIMDSLPGTVPFFMFHAAFSSVGHNRDLVLVRAEPPFDELAVFNNLPNAADITNSSRDDKFVYLQVSAPYIVQLATATHEIRKIWVGAYSAFALSSDETHLYTVNFNTGWIYKVEIATGQIVKEIQWGQTETRVPGTYIVTVQGPANGGGSVVSPDGRYWYLIPGRANEDNELFPTVHIWKFDMLTDTIVGDVDTGITVGIHMGAVMTPDGKYISIGPYFIKAVVQIDAENMTLVEVYEDPDFSNWHTVHSIDGDRFFVPMDRGESGYLALFRMGPEGLANNLLGYVGPFPRAMDSPSQRVVHMVQTTPDARFSVFDNMYEEEIYILDVANMGIAKTLKIGGAYEGRAPRHDWFGADHPVLTPNGKYVGLSVIYDTTQEIYDVETGERVYKASVGGGEATSSTHLVNVWAPGYQYGLQFHVRALPGPTPPDGIVLSAPTSNLLQRADIA